MSNKLPSVVIVTLPEAGEAPFVSALSATKTSIDVMVYQMGYGGVLDDEMLMALPPDQLSRAISGMEALAKNGFRYPFPQYGIQQDVRAGMAVSYPGRK